MQPNDRYQPTIRFTNRVDDYQRARPGYPAELTRWLLETTGLQRGDAVAELGAGTGLYTRDLLDAGLIVHAIEPNDAMRAAAEQSFANHPSYLSVAGRAEATGLAPRSVKLVVAAQAFHWFQPEPTYQEARRIAIPGGYGALIWNVRRIENPFAHDYEQLLLKHCPDYASGQPRQADPAQVAAFFAPAQAVTRSFDYQQIFDYSMLEARSLSSSYTPKEDTSAREVLLADLRSLFDKHEHAGLVDFQYYSQIYCAPLKT